MNKDIALALRLLEEENYTCVLCREGQTICHRERGVLPLLKHVRAEQTMSGFVAADRVVGKAAAFLYVLLAVDAVYACVMSRAALAVFEKYGIAVSYDTLTEKIRNRAGDGYCPMEEAVWEIEQPEAARCAIEKRLAELGVRQR